MSQEQKQSHTTIWSPLFICIIVLNLCIGTLAQFVNAGTPLYIQNLGGTNFYSGILVAVFVCSIIVTRIVSGALVDAYSRKHIMIFGAFIALGGSLLPLIESTVLTQVCSRIFLGVGFAVMHTAVSSSCADILPRERLGEGIGYAALGQALGMAVGPSLSLWLTGMEYTEALSLGLATIALIGFFLGFFVRYEKHPEKLQETASFRIAWDQKQMEQEASCDFASMKDTPQTHSLMNRFFEKSALSGALPMLFVAMGFSVFFSFTALFAKDMSYENPSLFYIVAAVFAILVRFFMSKSLDNRNALRLFAIPIVSSIVGLLGIFFIREQSLFYFFGACYGIGFGMAIPLLNSVIIKVSPPDRFGPANAFFFLFYDIGLGIGVFSWGFLLDAAGYAPVFLGGAICFAVAYLVAIKSFPREK